MRYRTQSDVERERYNLLLCKSAVNELRTLARQTDTSLSALVERSINKILLDNPQKYIDELKEEA